MLINTNKAQAIVKNIRISPRKLNLIAQLIRGLPVTKAVQVLTFSSKRAALDVKKALLSAVSNAENNHNMDVDSLIVNHAYVGKSLTLKRFQACAKGRGVGIRKPFSHLTIQLTEKAS